VIRQDYFLKFIEQLAKVLAKIVGLKNEGNTTEAIKLIDVTLVDLKYNDDLKDIPKEYLESVADLLKVKGEIEKDLEVMRKAMLLYMQVDELSKTYSMDRNSKIEELKNQLK
jgi:hypothetical protein